MGVTEESLGYMEMKNAADQPLERKLYLVVRI